MSDFLLEHSVRLIGMGVLLCASGFFSGSETALFSLSRDRLRRFQQGGSHLEHVAARLVARPRTLLVTILFGNMLVNAMFFALSSTMIWEIGARSSGPWTEGLAGLAVLMIVIVFGEVIPKTIAATAPVGLARLVAVPLYVLGRVVRPVTWLLDRTVIEPATRLVTGQAENQGQDLFLTADELQAVIDLAADEGVVGRDEGDMIGEALHIHETKVHEVMTHRVDMAACDIRTPMAEVLAMFRRTKHGRLVVYREMPDQVVGLVSARRAYLESQTPLEKLVEPVHFVPEQQTVERLLKVFRQKKIHVAVVVDEYGGTAGLVSLEDCLETIVGDIQDEYDVAGTPVERLNDRQFLLSGDLNMRAWSELLRTETDTETRADTLGGFVTGLLGRIPKVGDSCQWGNLRFTVRELACRPNGVCGRLRKVLVERLDEAGSAPGEGPSAAADSSAAGGPEERA